MKLSKRKMYDIEYLPIARQDMIDIVQYISYKLANPVAAEKLAEKMATATDRLVDFPYINRVYHPIRPLKQEYRILTVDNYLMFYYVDEASKLITIARIIYASREYEKLL